MIKRTLLKHLLDWQKSTTRKPLIVRGARQVGKTHLLKTFGEKYFKNLVYINLESVEHHRLFRKPMSLGEFEQIVNIVLKNKLVDGESLLFFDELQNSPTVVKLLRFFYEERPGLHVVAAGSLLEVKMQQQGLSLPVGRVQFAYLYPLDFFEFLDAKQENQMLEYLQQHNLQTPVPDAIHHQALALLKEYLVVGGMPELVKQYINKTPISQLRRAYSDIFQAYLEDIYKYSSFEGVKYLAHVLENAPLHAGEIISYQSFAGSNYKYREMSDAFAILQKALLLKMIPATNSKKIPLVGKTRRPHKLLFLDLGFVNYIADLFSQHQKASTVEDIYRGRLAEQAVGQNMLSRFQFDEPHLYYWSKEKNEGSAEVDFCLINSGKIVGIEVKAGHSHNLKSLKIFGDEVKNSIAVRLHSGNVEVGPPYHSLPLYLMPRVLEICE